MPYGTIFPAPQLGSHQKVCLRGGYALCQVCLITVSTVDLLLRDWVGRYANSVNVGRGTLACSQPKRVAISGKRERP